MTATKTKIETALAATMLVLAAGLWLSSGDQTRAASANLNQSVSATVTNSISWGNQGTCLQSAGAAAFGTLAAGSASTAPPVGTYTGCIGSNAQWSVTGTMGGEPAAGGNKIPAGAFRLETLTVPVGASAVACPTGNSSASCTLDNASVSLVANAPATPLIGTLLTNGFTYDYKMSVPANQPAGEYTGGVITLTASN
ncbi:MAG TPA: hypothetical protein VGO24_05360 [Solirubrobacterales bacterium]|jgi:hypothetical protein|nr:hypothetical protein [Solirubrobacterales bacterium]